MTLTPSELEMIVFEKTDAIDDLLVTEYSNHRKMPIVIEIPSYIPFENSGLREHIIKKYEDAGWIVNLRKSRETHHQNLPPKYTLSFTKKQEGAK
ncbi:hypothetical protein HYT23_01410 [Candidatus Pacearchaeota archaeon]|nr:hypothetical protein [Candidatus Pacearchaeota archaeon]